MLTVLQASSEQRLQQIAQARRAVLQEGKSLAGALTDPWIERSWRAASDSQRFNLTRTVTRQGWVGQLFHALGAYLGQRELDRLSFGAGDRLHQAQQGCWIDAIGLALLSIRRDLFQLHDLLVRLLRTRFLGEFALEVRPVAPGVIAVLQHLRHVNDRKPPSLSVFIVGTADRLAVKFSRQDFHDR